jgi:hypothetical protein
MERLSEATLDRLWICQKWIRRMIEKDSGQSFSLSLFIVAVAKGVDSLGSVANFRFSYLRHGPC